MHFPFHVGAVDTKSTIPFDEMGVLPLHMVDWAAVCHTPTFFFFHLHLNIDPKFKRSCVGT